MSLLLHLGSRPSSPHVERTKRLFARYAPEVRQVASSTGDYAHGIITLAIVHNATDPSGLALVESAPGRFGCPVVAWVWNDRFLTDEAYDRARVLRALDACALVIGSEDSAAREHVPAEKWVGIRAMVEASVFYPPPPGSVRDIPVLVARGWNGHPLYWAEETREALRGMEGVVYVDGRRTQGEMADLYRRSRCVVALREDAGPSYTVVEAALCGAVPVVSDTRVMRDHFEDEHPMALPRAAFARRDTIRPAVERALRLLPVEVQDIGEGNRAWFAPCTAEFTGRELVRRVLEVAAEEESRRWRESLEMPLGSGQRIIDEIEAFLEEHE